MCSNVSHALYRLYCFIFNHIISHLFSISSLLSTTTTPFSPTT